MTTQEKKAIINHWREEDGSCKCGLCGDTLRVDIKYVSVIAEPTRVSDFIPVCRACREDVGPKMINSYRTEIQMSVLSFMPNTESKKYLRARKYGMPAMAIPQLKVVFYFEKKMYKKIEAKTS